MNLSAPNLHREGRYNIQGNHNTVHAVHLAASRGWLKKNYAKWHNYGFANFEWQTGAELLAHNCLSASGPLNRHLFACIRSLGRLWRCWYGQSESPEDTQVDVMEERRKNKEDLTLHSLARAERAKGRPRPLVFLLFRCLCTQWLLLITKTSLLTKVCMYNSHLLTRSRCHTGLFFKDFYPWTTQWKCVHSLH